MRIRQIKDDHELNTFLNKQDFSQFLQSSYWRDILKAQGQKAHIISVVDDDEKIILSCLFVEYDYGSFKYYYMPRGPILDKKYRESREEAVKLLNFFLAKFKNTITNKRTLFLRLEPNFEDISEGNKFFPDLNKFKFKKTLDIQPSKTRLLDLDKSEVKLLEDMHGKTRYNIRLAKRKGVEIVSLKDENDIDIFINLLKTTSERNNFSLHQENHYRKLYHNGGDKLKIFFAKHGDDIIAGAMFSFFGDTVTYLHGASANKKRNLMAPHLLQWQTILKAKEKGFKYYDFGGIDEKKWPGVTRFKAGFGGREYNFKGTYDLVLKPLDYYIYTIVRKIRRKFL
ncbi:MAG TPA: peptidoglycan bridge formation glycyltransferase FemA/FemB family protein [Patescibacteria group bacterium]|nr:peptidoglycan bridge formation glycyltransferase FemA/FemB family protein [Patescibacteria group bacterium]